MGPIHLIAIALIWLYVTASSAVAQSGTAATDNPSDNSSRPTTGAVGVRPPVDTMPTFEASGGTQILRHRDFAGKTCLVVGGDARRHTIGSNLYDHVIIVRNNCPKRIAMEVCYYQTRGCIPMEIPGGERKEAILGTMPSMKNFRFEFREKF